MRIALLFFLLISPLIGGNIRIDILHQYEGKPLLLNSIRYGKSETFSISRLSYLLSSFAFQSDDGEW
ncbi:MAG: cytochrome C peroxidase, partial [Akkermansiaceae bacterium]|nr:cytochrome C peroxidase [Akkermansiaceae bacterium]